MQRGTHFCSFSTPPQRNGEKSGGPDWRRGWTLVATGMKVTGTRIVLNKPEEVRNGQAFIPTAQEMRKHAKEFLDVADYLESGSWAGSFSD